jgi:ADP-ribosylglycohydrolase
MHPLYDVVLNALKAYARQMEEEGHDHDALMQEVEAAASTGLMDVLTRLQEDFWHRPSPPDFPYDEPNDWETISSTFPDPESHAAFGGSDDDLKDRLLAAWQGRCVGCHLGRPIEDTAGANPANLKKTLLAVGSWPLEDYMNPIPDGLDLETVSDCVFFRDREAQKLVKGRFDRAVADDDIHYTVIGMTILERFGADFTSEQAMEILKRLTPPSWLFAACRSMFNASLFGLKSPYTARFNNPCSQSLGAVIRCDPWGWGAPANPALAASMAYRDAVNSQTRNGIYAAIFFSVMMADTLAHGDPVRAIDTAQQYVPPGSRFAEMLRFIREACAGKDDWEKIREAIHAQDWKYARQDHRRQFRGLQIHALPNAAKVLLAVLRGEGDFTRTVALGVMSGPDTDCNGATAGSIMGCALGTAGIPSHWTDPLNDTMELQLRGMCEMKISEAARRMFEAAVKNVRRT